MNKVSLMLILLFSGASVHSLAQTDFKLTTEKFSYQVPQKLVKACAKQLQQHQNDTESEPLDPKTACVNIDIELANSQYDWVNKTVNGEYHDRKQLKQHFDDEAEMIYELLQDADHYFKQTEISSELKLIATSPRLIQILSEDYEYHGGAHGMPSKSFYTFDSQLKKELMIDDILVNKNQRHALKTLAKHAFKNALKEKYKEMDDTLTEQEWQEYQQMWEFDLVENFYFTPNGVTFSYNPYAIGPYAFGFFVLNLDKKDLKGIIKAEYLSQKLQHFDDDEWSK